MKIPEDQPFEHLTPEARAEVETQFDSGFTFLMESTDYKDPDKVVNIGISIGYDKDYGLTALQALTEFVHSDAMHRLIEELARDGDGSLAHAEALLQRRRMN
jgi:hypothetical protein